MMMHSNSTPLLTLEVLDLGQRSLVNCHTTIAKDFSSGTTGPISFKFHLQPLGERRKKVYGFGPGHMTEMAVMPIYGKNLKKSSTTESMGQLP